MWGLVYLLHQIHSQHGLTKCAYSRYATGVTAAWWLSVALADKIEMNWGCIGLRSAHLRSDMPLVTWILDSSFYI